MKKNFGKKITVLPKVELKAIEEYEKKSEVLIEYVNDKLSQRDNLDDLIGSNSLNVMYDNHKNHAAFMINAFKINDYRFLFSTIIWVYSTYKNHNFSYNYFLVELNAWIEAVNNYISSKNATSINKVYKWMLENHDDFIQGSKKYKNADLIIMENFKEEYPSFIKFLLDGNYEECKKMIKQKIINENDVKEVFENIFFPSMYEVGYLWQKGAITVIEEHLASSVINRLISSIYSGKKFSEYDKGKALVSSIANEFHEIGSRIIADSLEMDGWNVKHLGANTPEQDFIEYIKKEKPFLIGLSVTMQFNVDKIIRLISQIRSIPDLEDINILVGGKVFNENSNLYKKVGADIWGKNSIEVVELAGKLWKEKVNERKHI